MAYNKTFLLNLGPAKTGLTLKAQIVDTSGVAVGASTSSGFIELGNGYYFWTGNIADGQQGGIIFMDSGGSGGPPYTSIETILPINLDDQVLSDHITATIVDASPSTSTFKGDTTLLSSVDNMYRNMVLVFMNGTLKGVSNRIYSYTGSTRAFVFNMPFAQAPANGDKFIIIGRVA
jgi:hypothetical protein